MAIMLAILFRGLRALGVPQRSARRIALRCAVDSIPLTRRRALDALKDGEMLNTSEVTRQVGADRKVVRFALEELELLGAVRSDRIKKDVPEEDHRDAHDYAPRDWQLAGDEGKTIARVLGEVARHVE
jgi:DNA-binding transcriptional ArsR family regulator